jgi:hypothetical protein
MSITRLPSTGAEIKLGEFPAHLFAIPQREPVPTEASGPVAPSIRYYITDELWSAFSEEQVALQKARMIETGRWLPPSGRFTLRLPFETLFAKAGVEVGSSEEALRNQIANAIEAGEITSAEQIDSWEAAEIETFCDVEISDGKVFNRFHSLRRYFPGKSVFDKQMILREGIKTPPTNRYHGLLEWWDRGSWLCERWNVFTDGCSDDVKLTTFLEEKALDVLTIILHDRSVHRVEIEPKPDGKNWHLLGLSDQRPAMPTEITLQCPRRAYTGDGEGTHASPWMHYRAEHLRNQPYGPRKAPMYRQIVIAAQWINAADVDPADLGTPIRHYKLVGGV